jgi:hypothetical protein
MVNCAICRSLLTVIRRTRKFCSNACRQQAYRNRIAVGSVKLRDCSVEPIPRSEAAPFILKHEHLKTVGNAKIFFGLRSPIGKLLGVARYGHGAHASGRDADVVLERGHCLVGTPRNSASY